MLLWNVVVWLKLSTHYPVGGSRIRGESSPELNWVNFSAMKWKEHLPPQGGEVSVWGTLLKVLLDLWVSVLVLVRSWMVQSKFYSRASIT